MEQKRALATCVAAILPLCLLSAAISLWRQPLDWMQALPYLLGTGRRLRGRPPVSEGIQPVAAAHLRLLSAVRRREVSPVTAWLLPLAVGFATGILSAWGVGGGTLLLLCMTLLLGWISAPPRPSTCCTSCPPPVWGCCPTGKVACWKSRCFAAPSPPD